jgi:chorismate-pyruvate lyase
MRYVVLVAVALAAQDRSAPVDRLAQLQALSAQLLASSSATQTLENWCRDHHLADQPRIVARLAAGVAKPATAEQRARLEVADDGAIRYRHVELQCGSRVLSEADNWYVPARLDPAMNRLLETTDTPFGRAVAPLQPTRTTFAVRVMWADTTQPMGPTLFEHRALLFTRDHRPFAEVDEMYQRALLGDAP